VRWRAVGNDDEIPRLSGDQASRLSGTARAGTGIIPDACECGMHIRLAEREFQAPEVQDRSWNQTVRLELKEAPEILRQLDRRRRELEP